MAGLGERDSYQTGRASLSDIERTHPYFHRTMLRYDTHKLDLGDTQVEFFIPRASGKGRIYVTTAGDIIAVQFGTEIKVANATPWRKTIPVEFHRGCRTFFFNDHSYRFRIGAVRREGAELSVRSTHEFRATPISK